MRLGLCLLGILVIACTGESVATYKVILFKLRVNTRQHFSNIFIILLCFVHRGEYYAMQIDAHVTFVTDWDVDIIKQFEATNNEMAVLSTYLTDIVGSIDKITGLSKRNTRPIMVSQLFTSASQVQY